MSERDYTDADRRDQEPDSACPWCGALDTTPNVEAFEVYGDVMCDDCAETRFAGDAEALAEAPAPASRESAFDRWMRVKLTVLGSEEAVRAYDRATDACQALAQACPDSLAGTNVFAWALAKSDEITAASFAFAKAEGRS